MRGVSFSSFTGPGVSALYICMPPTPSSGRTATASTMMPMPPIQCSVWRHRFTDCGRSSRWLSTVEPVVVRPDTASKYASMKLRPGMAIMNGIAADADISVQDSDTSRKPSRGFNSRWKRRVAAATASPMKALISAAATKSMTWPSCTVSDQAMGSRYSSPKKAIIKPRTWATASTVDLSPAGAGEQPLDLLDVAPVGEEHDHVVVVGDHGVVVGDVHFVAAHHGADDGAFGQRDLAHALAHHARGLVRAVHHGLERLGRTAPQRVHAHHVATAHVRQQRSDGDGLRRNGDVDAARLHEVGV